MSGWWFAAPFAMLAAAWALAMRAERRLERRLTARLLAARAQAPGALIRVPQQVPRGPCRCGDCCQCGDWLAGCPVHTRDFWAARISEESAS